MMCFYNSTTASGGAAPPAIFLFLIVYKYLQCVYKSVKYSARCFITFHSLLFFFIFNVKINNDK